MPRPITFLSDYGLEDEFVGVVHAVIAHECPTARVIDLSHGVPRQLGSHTSELAQISKISKSAFAETTFWASG